MKDLSSVVKVYIREREKTQLSHFFVSILPTNKSDLGADHRAQHGHLWNTRNFNFFLYPYYPFDCLNSNLKYEKIFQMLCHVIVPGQVLPLLKHDASCSLLF